MSFPQKRESSISGFPLSREQAWIPAFAGMTIYMSLDSCYLPAQAQASQE